ncbi:hypothetical protein BROUX41_004202 [Berkeleyomyces rouxiae]|uniref:uncharacterized protein n=1 Tax=Berkeleyomyces rouxiae TaxID=2035830 RepID=UPI003B7E53D5
MVRYSFTVSFLTLASSFTGALAVASDSKNTQDDGMERILENRWVVMVDQETNPSVLREKLKHEDITIKKHYDFSLFKGASIELINPETSEDLFNMLSSLEGVIIGPVTSYSLPNLDASIVEDPEDPEGLSKRDFSEVDTIDPATGLNFDSTHDMTQVSRLHAMGRRGKHVNVAIIDSGIDYLHPDLGECFGPRCLVERGHDFVGDNFDGSSPPDPSFYPMDCAGSGTYMAGVIAAQGKQSKFTGAAPEVSLGAYKVFGCHRITHSDILIEAFNKAYEDGANIITSSISRPSGWANDPWALLVQRIIDMGVLCILPAGNDGAKGLFYAADTASAKGSFAVGAVDNTNTPKLTIPSTYRVDGGDPIDFEWTKGRPYKHWGNVQDYEVFPVNLDTSAEAQGCSADDYGSESYPNLKGKVVLVRRGGCEIIKKAFIASALGGHYVIVYNNVSGTIELPATEVPRLRGIAMVTPEMGEFWVKEMADGKKITLNMANPRNIIPKLSVSSNTETGGSMTSISSWGPTWDMDVSPLASAPGGNVLSTYPRALGSYAVLSSTSLAASMLTAVAALVGDAHKNFNPQILESLLTNYAIPQASNIVTGTDSSKYLAPVPQQGAGLVQAYSSAFGKAIFSKPYISFNPDNTFQETIQFEIINLGDTHIWYKVAHMPALTVYAKESSDDRGFSHYPNKMDPAYASVTISEEEFLLGPNEKKILTLTASPPEGLDPREVPVWSGYMTFTDNDKTQMVLPYQGMTGSLKDIPTFVDTRTYLTFIPGNEAKPYEKQCHLPIKSIERWALPAQGTTKANAPAGVELPGFQVKLATGTPLLLADLVPISRLSWLARTKTVLGARTMGSHPSFPKRFLTRDTFVYSFDGRLADGTYALTGEYKWLLRALKIGGNPNDPKDYESIETRSFQIVYEDEVDAAVTTALRSKTRPELFPVVRYPGLIF